MGVLGSLAVEPFGVPIACDGFGVRGVENGWAAEVEVAGGGLVGAPRRGAVDRLRETGLDASRRREQRRQSMSGDAEKYNARQVPSSYE